MNQLFVLILLAALAVIGYFTLKNSIYFVIKHLDLRKSGISLEGIIVDFNKNKYTVGSIPIIEYEFEGKKYKSEIIHDEFSPSFMFKHKKIVKILADKNNPELIIVDSPFTITSTYIGILLVLVAVIGLTTLFITS